MADCLNNEEQITSNLDSTNQDSLNSELSAGNAITSEINIASELTSNTSSGEMVESSLIGEEQLASQLDLPVTHTYRGAETDNIVVSVDNNSYTISASLKQIKFKTVDDFPVVGSDRLLYIDATENSLYSWDSDLGEYRKLVADTGDVDVDLSNYYTKEETYSAKEIDDKISNVEVDLSGYYTKTETDNLATQTLNLAKGYTDTKVAELIDSAPETLDTFKEIADAFAEDQEVLDALNSAIGLKADKAELSSYATKTELNTGLDEKVDKVTGKGLSTNDYTTDEKNKLASLKNYDDTSVKADITALQQNKADKTELSNYVTNTALESKGYLTEIPSEYVTETELETKNYATKTELSNGLNNKVDKVDGKGLSTNDLTDDLLGKINNNTVIEITESSVHIKDLGSGIYKLPMGCTFSFYATNKFTAPSESYLFVTETNEGRREFYILCSDYYAQTGIGNKYLISGYAYIPSAVGYSYKFVINKDYVDTSTDQSEIYGTKTFKKPVKMTEELSQNVIDDDTLVTAKWTKDKLDTKQDKLDAGTGITIEGNRISASLGDGAQIIKLPSPVIIYGLDSGVYQLPIGCMLYINSSMVDEMARVKYDNTSVALMVVASITNPDSRVDKLFYLFAEKDGVNADTVGNSGSFIVGKAKQDTGNYHIVGTDIAYVTQETDGYINGNKSFVNPVKYYKQYESLDTSLNDRTLVDAQWVKSQGYLNESGLADKGYIDYVKDQTSVALTKSTGSGANVQASKDPLTERAIATGLPYFNGKHDYTDKTEYFVPTTSGTTGQILVANSAKTGIYGGTWADKQTGGEPEWKNPSDLGLITETELNAKGYLTSVPSEYVTETELTNKGYATQTSLNSTNSTVSSLSSTVSSHTSSISTLSKRYVTATYSSGSTWYTKYNDGWKECGMILSGGSWGSKSASLPISFSNTNYICCVTPIMTNSNTGTYQTRESFVNSKSTGSINLWWDGTMIKQVYCCGY